MNPPTHTTAARIKDLLDLPGEARPADVYECVMGCFTEGLGYEPIPAARVPGPRARYQAGWRSPKGATFIGEGPSRREAALVAALRLIAESEDALLLRSYAEPELRKLTGPPPRTQPLVASAHRRAGFPE